MAFNFNGTPPESIIFTDKGVTTMLDKLIYNGVTVWESYKTFNSVYYRLVNSFYSKGACIEVDLNSCGIVATGIVADGNCSNASSSSQHQLRIWGSNDKSSWTQLTSKTSTSATYLQTNTLSYSDGCPYRYLRVRDENSDTGGQWRSVNIYLSGKKKGTAPTSNTVTRTNYGNRVSPNGQGDGKQEWDLLSVTSWD